MPRSAPLPLRKVTLNLYDEDVVALEHFIGHGWSETVRDQVHAFVLRKLRPRNLIAETFPKDLPNV